MGWIYFVQRGAFSRHGAVAVALGAPAAREPVKIGFSVQPAVRLAQLSWQHQAEMRVVGLIRGGTADEASLHARFVATRIRSMGLEWFDPSPGLVDFIGALPTPDIDIAMLVRAHRVRPPRRAVQGARFDGARELDVYLRERNESVPDFCVRARLDRHQTDRLLRGNVKRSPSTDFTSGVEVATDGRVVAGMWRSETLREDVPGEIASTTALPDADDTGERHALKPAGS